MSNASRGTQTANNIKIATNWLAPESTTISKDERALIDERIAALVKRLDEVTK